MSKLRLSKSLSERISDFKESDLYQVKSTQAKSEYWKYFSETIESKLEKESINIEGKSGVYIPNQSKYSIENILSYLKLLLSPTFVLRRILEKIGERIHGPFLMSYENSYNCVMKSEPISDPDLSRFRINHHLMINFPGILGKVSELKKHYKKWSGFELQGNVIQQYYFQNIIRTKLNQTSLSTVLEIGPGNGNLASILYQEFPGSRFILIDLPETSIAAISFIGNVYPNSKILLPQECSKVALKEGDFDFAFLTVDQLSLLSENSIDLAINVHSFQEMTHSQIATYFDLIQNTVKSDGYFFTANRVEKIPTSGNAYTQEQLDPPNLFSEYPWRKENLTLVYEISRLHRLTQLDDIFIKLEQIKK